MTDKNLLANLDQFTDTEEWFRHAINRKVLYTEGVQCLAEEHGAYWLIDEIALAQIYEKAVQATPFQTWHLSVKEDRSATLACEDGNDQVVYAKEIPFTDFPVKGIWFLFVDNVLMLTSEY